MIWTVPDIWVCTSVAFKNKKSGQWAVLKQKHVLKPF
jgi:hypothetical protein